MTPERRERRDPGPEQLRIDQLERATVRLAEQVAGLNSALTSVAEIERRQTRIDERTDALEQNVVPRAEHERDGRAQAAALRAYRRQVVAKIYLWSSVLAVALVVAVLGLTTYLQHERELTEEFRSGTFTICTQRGLQAQKVRAYLDSLQPQIDSLPPEQRQAAQAQRQALLDAFPVISCEPLRKGQP